MKLLPNEIRDITKHLEAGKGHSRKVRYKIAVEVVDIFVNDTMKVGI